MKLALGDLAGGLILGTSDLGAEPMFGIDSRDLGLWAGAGDRLSFERSFGVRRKRENLSLELLRAGDEDEVEDDLSCSVIELLRDPAPELDRLEKKSETA